MGAPAASLRVAMVGMALAGAAIPAGSHEFWIEPAEGILAPGDDIVANLRVGEELEGAAYPFIRAYTPRFELHAQGQAWRIDALDGDLPAILGAEAQPGLNVLVHTTVPFTVTHQNWEDFAAYLHAEGLGQIPEAHHKRGLPAAGFAERYTRYARALVQAGPVDPTDGGGRQELAFEIEAERNPYAAGHEYLPVRLFWQGAPVTDWQIAMIHRGSDDRVARIVRRTDSAGRTTFPLDSGEILLSAVRMEPTPDAQSPWHSHWASLSFAVPER